MLPTIISANQTGYVKGRYIGESIRIITDMMCFTKKKNIPGLAVFLDFEKAFDSIQWCYLQKCLETFNFGPQLRQWIRVLYNNISSCVLNNGFVFYLSLLQTIVKNDFDKIENIIMGGDFNRPLNPTVDKRGGNLFPRQYVINTIEELQSELDLHDIWRIKNPTTRSYTWSQSEPPIFSRLDYWLILNSLADNICSVDIIPRLYQNRPFRNPNRISRC